MKKIILPALIAALVSVQSIAEYQVQYGERQISGDNIKFVTYGNWVAADPSISAWVNDGALTGCFISTDSHKLSTKTNENCSK